MTNNINYNVTQSVLNYSFVQLIFIALILFVNLIIDLVDGWRRKKRKKKEYWMRFHEWKKLDTIARRIPRCIRRIILLICCRFIQWKSINIIIQFRLLKTRGQNFYMLHALLYSGCSNYTRFLSRLKHLWLV